MHHTSCFSLDFDCSHLGFDSPTLRIRDLHDPLIHHLFIFHKISYRSMALINGSVVTEFILLGLTDQPDLQVPLFLVFLLMYMITALGNLTLIILIVLNSHLHTPMYFFLFNLSFVDFCYSSVIIPKMLMNFILKKNFIS